MFLRHHLLSDEFASPYGSELSCIARELLKQTVFILFVALWVSCSAEPSLPPGEVADKSTVGPLSSVLGDQADAAEAVFSHARKAGVKHVVLMKGGPSMDQMKLTKLVIWNLAAQVVYPNGTPKGYGRYEPGLQAIPELNEMAKISGFAEGYRDDVLYEIWKEIPMPISMELKPDEQRR